MSNSENVQLGRIYGCDTWMNPNDPFHHEDLVLTSCPLDLPQAGTEDYQEWIDQLDNVMGQCEKVTERMAEAFPNLRRVRGHYHCWIWGKREHWWLMDGEEVVDPTAAQFPSKGEGSYVEWTGSQEPTGKCPNCGEYCFDGEYVHEHCHDEFMRSLI